VAVKELVNAKAKLQPTAALILNGSNSMTSSQFMRKTVSVPNISHVSLFSGKLVIHKLCNTKREGLTCGYTSA
jgi:hypothetical protein